MLNPMTLIWYIPSESFTTNPAASAAPQILQDEINHGGLPPVIHESQGLHEAALASSGRFTRVLGFLHLSNHLLECFGHVDVEPCTSLCKAAVEFFSQPPTLFGRDVALVGSQIAFVPDDN